MTRFHLRGLLKRLADHQVTYVIVGGVGARLQGSPNITGDLDIVPDPSADNLALLAAAISGPVTTPAPTPPSSPTGSPRHKPNAPQLNSTCGNSTVRSASA